MPQKFYIENENLSLDHEIENCEQCHLTSAQSVAMLILPFVTQVRWSISIGFQEVVATGPPRVNPSQQRPYSCIKIRH